MATLHKSDAWWDSVLAILKSDPDAQFRLSNILPEEVSLVDRAANKRRFLTIKQENGVKNMFTNKIPANVRKEMDTVLAAALNQLMEITKAVGSAEETADAVELPMPDEMASSLLDVAVQISDLMKAYPSNVGKELEMISNLGTEASDKMKAMAAVIAEIAEADSPGAIASIMSRLFNVDKSVEPTEENTKKLQLLFDGLSQLMPTQKQDAPAKEEPTAPAADPSEAAVDKGAEPVTEPPKDVDPVAATDSAGATEPTAAEKTADTEPPVATAQTEPETGDTADIVKTADEMIAGYLTEIEKKGAKMSAARLNALRGAIKTLTALVDEMSPVSPAPAAKVADDMRARSEDTSNLGSVGSGGSPEDRPVAEAIKDDPNNLLAPIMKRMQTLENELKILQDAPEPPASRQDTGADRQSPEPQPQNTERSRWLMT